MTHKRRTILIVEDEPMLRDVYYLVLKNSGYDVITAINGFEGIKQFKQHHPDVVLLDVMMPVMDGREFMQNIDMSDYPGTTVIVYSNMSDRAVEQDMIALGASEFVVKSNVTPAGLVALIDRTTQDPRVIS